MSVTKFRDLVNDLREQTFMMNDEEAAPVMDEFLREHPEMLTFQNREWFTKYC